MMPLQCREHVLNVKAGIAMSRLQYAYEADVNSVLIRCPKCGRLDDRLCNDRCLVCVNQRRRKP